MDKQSIVRFFRSTHLLPMIDYSRFVMDVLKNDFANRAFLRRHPGFSLPPKSLSYDAYGTTNVEMYFRSGREVASFLAGLMRKHADFSAGGRVYEWGCGPARIIRHLPELFPGEAIEVYGSDYNEQSVDWCRRHITNVTFVNNALEPPVHLPDAYFDVIYNYSVFTHLSESSHFQWVSELRRLLKPGGILILTTHGDATRSNLLSDEGLDYDSGKLVVRGKVSEGKRCYVAFHSPVFIGNKLLADFEIVEHINAPTVCYPQDVWIARRPTR